MLGDYGFWRGRYGLLADQLVEARMVLADGTALTVSEDSHKDLLWGICGAGHNFGVATGFGYKMYDLIRNSTWAYEAFMFTGDKLEALCLLTNKVMKPKPPQVVNYALIFHPLLSFSWPPFPTFILDISTLHAYIMSSTGLMSHSSWMISDDVALTSGSQVNIFRINFRNISFSSPGGIMVTKSSKEVLGIGGSDIQLPIVIECQVHLVQSSD
jgi:hypothetical protein